jgi:hypothetical protein
VTAASSRATLAQAVRLFYHYSVKKSKERTYDDQGIGTYQESSLHAALKSWYARPGDELEVNIEGYIVDIVRGDLLIEIQTGNFSALKSKLPRLASRYRVHLVHPIPKDKWILRKSPSEKTLSRRKSPKRGGLEDLFTELVRIPALITHPNITIEVLLVQEEEIWQDDGKGSWRRKGWSIADRRLLDVLERFVLASPSDFRDLLPDNLPEPFTARDLARALHRPPYLARKMVYCLHKMGAASRVGKRGQAYLYSAAGEINDPL